ncbi:MAG: hypothetical protein EXR75_06040 [Myxococcales bacterium]|nr:hypothetical protein [Myxococcales bacterium]
MLADSGYGDAGEFRDGVRKMGFDYALDVKKRDSRRHRVRRRCRNGSDERGGRRRDHRRE